MPTPIDSNSSLRRRCGIAPLFPLALVTLIGLTLGLAVPALSASSIAENAIAENAIAENAVQVTLETSQGAIVLELYPDKAPKSVANFLEYVRSGYYDGTVFHRVIDGFMIQGGGFDQELKQKSTRDPITNEAENGLSNVRGTIAMARTSDPHSATSQFFISVADNGAGLDQGKTGDGWGYAVFGKVVEGMDVVDEIAKVDTGVQLATTKTGPSQMRDVPRTPVVLVKASAN